MSAKKTAKKTPKKSAQARADRMQFESATDLQEFLKEQAADRPGGNRLVVRGSVLNDPHAPGEDSPEEDAPKSSGVWGSKPSVANQLTLHPTTIRTKAPITCQFVLSDADHLANWNALQARMHPPSEPQVRLDMYESSFAQAVGSYVLLVTYSEIEYQQLL